MGSDNNNSQKNVSYEKLRVTENQKKYIENYCKRERISKQHFFQTRVFDTPSRANEHREMLIRRSPRFYIAINRIKKADIRDDLLSWFDEILKAMEE